VEFKDARGRAHIWGYKNDIEGGYLNGKISCKRLICVEKRIMGKIYGSRQKEKKDFQEGKGIMRK